MDSQLKERISILEMAGETTNEISQTVIMFSERFESKFDIELTEENSSMLITHLAMALARIKKGEAINEIDEMVSNEVRSNEYFSKLGEFFELLEDKLEITVPESEKDYIALHACTIITKYA